MIPKQLHFETPNPRIPWEELPVRVAAEAMHWPGAPGRPRRAAVSSFGLSGTNAHVVLEGYGAPGEPGGAADRVGAEELGVSGREVRLLPLSARTPAALRELAGRYLSWFMEGGALRRRAVGRGVDGGVGGPTSGIAPAWCSATRRTSGSSSGRSRKAEGVRRARGGRWRSCSRPGKPVGRDGPGTLPERAGVPGGAGPLRGGVRRGAGRGRPHRERPGCCR